MLISQWIYNKDEKWEKVSGVDNQTPDLILVFGVSSYFRDKCYADLREKYPASNIVGCSTAGSIVGEVVGDITTATFISLKKGHMRVAFKDLLSPDDSQLAGETIAKELQEDSLKHVFVLSEGLNINGSELAIGFNTILEEKVLVTGGLSGDGMNFEETYVIANSQAVKNRVVAIGFYGESMEIKSGCFAGWDEFGAERMITKSKGNVLYEIDSKPALQLYKSYLAEQVADLPASGLKFPINIRKEKTDKPLIRTLLAVNEEEQSLTFAGDVPEGHYCRLMKSNMDKLIDNAGFAAEQAKINSSNEKLCIAVSCVGRRIVMSQLVEEEIDSIKEVLGENTAITGFYSYGELAPLEGLVECALHNQTMTLTVINENL